MKVKYSCAKMIGILRRTEIHFGILHLPAVFHQPQHLADQSRSNRGSIALKSRINRAQIAASLSRCLKLDASRYILKNGRARGRGTILVAIESSALGCASGTTLGLFRGRNLASGSIVLIITQHAVTATGVHNLLCVKAAAVTTL